ncbi:hypothetical protein BKA67DRAFT_651321 [Truncatella angustata]|uniref:Protein kinase domain-containing protein n=1 Tax=Truncatella angustata TaxID=152316 RepID=A0A9P8RJR7_9PEZI|nr:uncharacterized protein BKA67DRAFT_651321 [Truncatella angustata]KAH6645568.1 hypothetical protein BKA67DRAFT_651321 [Truncatella angustata]
MPSGAPPLEQPCPVHAHGLVAGQFAVETDKELTSKGPITNPRNKLCPNNLRPWSDFLEQQRTTLGALYGTFPVSDRRFESRGFDGPWPANCQATDILRKDARVFLHNGVEDPVREIFDQSRDVDQVPHEFGIGNGIVFENHPNVISDVAEEVVDRQASSIPPQTPDQGKDPGHIRPDQICVYRFDDELSTRRTMLYVSEYKAPAQADRSTPAHVVNQKTIPTAADPDGRFQYHAERLTAAAITQTYNYTIEGGLEYGLLTTGETIVFLRVDWREPGTLLYHLAEPAFEVAAQSGQHHACTAVGQYLAFSLLALGRPVNPPTVRSQDERQRVILELRRWAKDFETTLRSIPRDERYAPSSSSSSSLYAPTTYAGISRSPRVPRTRRKRWAQEEDRPDVQPRFRDRDDESSSDESSPPMPDTPTPYYDHRVYIEYLLLLSHGSPIDEAARAGEVKRCLQAIHRACVVHWDVRRTNVLRNTDTGELMLIDFERSVVKAGRKPLGNIVPNKRSWNGQRKGTTAPMYSHAPGDASWHQCSTLSDSWAGNSLMCTQVNGGFFVTATMASPPNSILTGDMS